MNLEDLQVYQKSMEMAEAVWDICENWGEFERDTVARPLIKSLDALAVNISIGYGRLKSEEKLQFGYAARGAVFETKTWLSKALSRNLLSQEQADFFFEELEQLSIRLNNYLKSIVRKTGDTAPLKPRRNFRDNYSVHQESFTPPYSSEEISASDPSAYSVNQYTNHEFNQNVDNY